MSNICLKSVYIFWHPLYIYTHTNMYNNNKCSCCCHGSTINDDLLLDFVLLEYDTTSRNKRLNTIRSNIIPSSSRVLKYYMHATAGSKKEAQGSAAYHFKLKCNVISKSLFSHYIFLSLRTGLIE